MVARVKAEAKSPRLARSTIASNSAQVIRASGLQKTQASDAESAEPSASGLADRQTFDPGNRFAAETLEPWPWRISASGLSS